MLMEFERVVKINEKQILAAVDVNIANRKAEPVEF